MDYLNQYLPPELLRAIFLLLLQTKGARSVLVSVCRLWREIIINTATFWTRIQIAPRRSDIRSLQQDPHIWATLISRAGTIPIDVDWHIEQLPILGQQVVEQAFRHFLEKAPYNRWRTLRIGATEELLPILEGGDFEILESLTVTSAFEPLKTFLDLIEKKATRLRTLNVQNSTLNFRGYFGTILQRITTLKCRNLNSYSDVAFSNITHLQISLLAPVPHILLRITNLSIKYLELNRLELLAIPNLEMLDIHSTSYGSRTRPFHFPTLQYLTFRDRNYQPLTYFNIPGLRELRLIQQPYFTVQRSDSLQAAVSPPMYSLSPTSLVLDAKIQLPSILAILSRSGRLSQLTLRFDEPRSDWVELKKAFRIPSGTTKDLADLETEDGSWQNLCPYLISLQILLSWNQNDSKYWKDFCLGILRERKGAPLRSVACIWDDGNQITVSVDSINHL